ncbi:MAG: high-potential iron-sulfur protein [Gammaproteobacteria bacterium]|nr:high-potential iron-sulfur protein [Gammaproteobacteria bacterium]MDE2349081.1 high-potential iron-sulfur protein [Gammaproteobacteria bacterium]
MSSNMSRREALKNMVVAAGALAAVRGAVAGTAMPHVDPSDPMAAGVSYHVNAAKVDAAKFPQFKPGSKCANCVQVGGKDGEAWRPCNIFAGKLVSANGWCTVYAPKA